MMRVAMVVLAIVALAVVPHVVRTDDNIHTSLHTPKSRRAANATLEELLNKGVSSITTILFIIINNIQQLVQASFTCFDIKFSCRILELPSVPLFVFLSVGTLTFSLGFDAILHAVCVGASHFCNSVFCRVRWLLLVLHEYVCFFCDL